MLRVGIIGLGVGAAHIKGYLDNPSAKVVALCDFSLQKRQEFSELYPNVEIFQNAEEIIKNPKIDVVSIATYDNYHCEQIISAIDNGKHIFVEKPLCLTKSEARRIRLKLKQNPSIKLSSNLILRKSPLFNLIKQRIASRIMGEIFALEGDYNYGRLHKITDGWRGDIDFYSVILGGAIHLVDLMMWTTEKKITHVTSMGNNHCTQSTKFKYNDYTVSLLQFEDGSIGKATANYGCVYPHFHKVSIYGTKATFENTLRGGFFYSSRDPNATPEVLNASYKEVHKGDMISSFIDSIFGKRKADIDAEDVFRSLSVCLAMEESLSQNEKVKVEYI